MKIIRRSETKLCKDTLFIEYCENVFVTNLSRSAKNRSVCGNSFEYEDFKL